MRGILVSVTPSMFLMSYHKHVFTVDMMARTVEKQILIAVYTLILISTKCPAVSFFVKLNFTGRTWRNIIKMNKRGEAMLNG